jgi:hypothetical protein
MAILTRENTEGMVPIYSPLPIRNRFIIKISDHDMIQGGNGCFLERNIYMLPLSSLSPFSEGKQNAHGSKKRSGIIGLLSKGFKRRG